MCKSKSDGGQRCNGHRRQAVGGSVATLAAAVTPLSAAEVGREITKAAAEGTPGLPAERDDIDAFLEDTISKAETCDSLTDRKRASIVGRLREAVGRLKVDTSTLRAWKASVAAAWSRVGRATGTVFLAASLAAGVGGCGAGDEGHVPEPTVSAPAVAPEVATYAVDAFPDLEVPADVVTYFGSKANAEKAYKRASKAYVDALMDAETLSLTQGSATPDAFKIRAALTPEARATFDERLKAAAAGDEQAYRDTGALTLYDAVKAGGGVSFTPGTPSAAVQRRVEKPRIALGSDGRPKVTFVARGSMRITEDGARVLSPYAVLTTLHLTKDGKISGWSGDWTAAEAGPQTPDRW